MKKNVTIAALMLVFVILLAVIPVFADSHHYDVNLPRLQMHTNLCSGTKTTYDNNATNYVHFLGGSYKKMFAWVDLSSGGAVTAWTTCYKGVTTTIPYKVRPSIGTALMARGANSVFAFVNVNCDGTFNFK